MTLPNQDWKTTSKITLCALLERAAEVGACIPTTGTDPGPDPKAVEALGKLIVSVSDVVTAGETLDGGGNGDE